MTPKDAATCAEFWKVVRSLTEIAHTRGANGLTDLLMEEFAALPEAEKSLIEKQFNTLMALLPFLKQARSAVTVNPQAKKQNIPYSD